MRNPWDSGVARPLIRIIRGFGRMKCLRRGHRRLHARRVRSPTYELLREYYERVLLIAAAAVLFICSIFIWKDAIELRFAIRRDAAGASAKNCIAIGEGPGARCRDRKIASTAAMDIWRPIGLVRPGKTFYRRERSSGDPPNHAKSIRRFQTNGWSNLDCRSPTADVLEQDPDNDGFNNLDEWAGHTNPTDPNSHPEYYTKLKLKSATEEPFRLVFSSWVGDTFAINTIDMKQPTQFVKVGDSIKGTRFKVTKFVEKYQPNKYGTNVDVSELTLEQDETHQQLTLVKEKVAMSPESVATFVYTWGGRQEFSGAKRSGIFIETAGADQI